MLEVRLQGAQSKKQRHTKDGRKGSTQR